jgi:hypothetical protein
MHELGYCFNTLCRENSELFSSSYRHLSMRRSLTVSMCVLRSFDARIQIQYSTCLEIVHSLETILFEKKGINIKMFITDWTPTYIKSNRSFRMVHYTRMDSHIPAKDIINNVGYQAVGLRTLHE